MSTPEKLAKPSKDFSLYRIAEGIKELDDHLDNEVMAKDGEIIEFDKDRLAALLKDKVDGCVEYERYLRHRGDTIDVRIKELQQAKKTNTNKLKSYKNYILFIMENILKENKVEGETHKISLRNNQKSLIIDDVESLPMEFVNVSRSVVADKAMIKEALKNKQTVPGARLVESEKSAIFKIG